MAKLRIVDSGASSGAPSGTDVVRPASTHTRSCFSPAPAAITSSA
jgi:hypothetical protein